MKRLGGGGKSGTERLILERKMGTCGIQLGNRGRREESDGSAVIMQNTYFDASSRNLIYGRYHHVQAILRTVSSEQTFPFTIIPQQFTAVGIHSTTPSSTSAATSGALAKERLRTYFKAL